MERALSLDAKPGIMAEYKTTSHDSTAHSPQVSACGREVRFLPLPLQYPRAECLALGLQSLGVGRASLDAHFLKQS